MDHRIELIDPDLLDIVGAADDTLLLLGEQSHRLSRHEGEGDDGYDEPAPALLSEVMDSKAVDDSVDDSPAGAGAESSGGVEKDKKATSKKDEDAKKRTRQSQSCDACRARKVKCDRPAPTAGVSPASEDKCTHCRQLHMDCTFDYKPKKRGPPNQYLKRLEREREAALSNAGQSKGKSRATEPDSEPEMSTSKFDFTLPPTPPITSDGPTFSQGPAYVHPLVEKYNALEGLGGTLSRQMAYGQSALNEQGTSPGIIPGASRGMHINSLWDETLARAVAATGYSPSSGHDSGMPGGHSYARTPSTGVSAHDYAQERQEILPQRQSVPIGGPPASLFSLSPQATLGLPGGGSGLGGPALNRRSSSFSQHDRPPRPGNPLDAVLPRWLLYHVVELYFDYVYPLIPAIHRPTFMRDLESHREERPDGDEWTHMTFGLIAATLVQVPRAFVPLRRREVKRLAQTCLHLARSFTLNDGRDVTIQRLTMNYFLTITNSIIGHPSTSAYLMGAQAGILLRGRWNDESMYANLPPLERELRRRIYWIAYDGDRSYAAIEGNTTIFTEDECSTVNLPIEVDDEFISDEGVGQQPEGRVSIITGFNYISKLYRLCGVAMDRRRRDKRDLPSGVLLQVRLNEVNELYDQVVGLMDDCPEPLRLGAGRDGQSSGPYLDDWDAQASADIRSLFLDPKVNKNVVKDAYLVQQGNIYVTQQMVRYMVLNYRDELLLLQQAELTRASGTASLAVGTGTSSSGPGGLNRRKSMSRREWSRALIDEEEKAQVATDLLMVLQKIPIQVIAVNTASLVHKVRFVASTLLDALAAPNAPDQAGLNPDQARAMAKTQRAQTYLWDFLRILSEIEALYSLDDNDD